MPEVMDWDAAYRDEVFAGPPPWNIGEPQPEFAELIRDGKVVGDVLDVGCGVGDIALDLAARGYRVVGIDVAKEAIAAAVKAAEERGLSTATFVQGELTSFTDYHDRFDTVLDCLLLHSLLVEARDDYLCWAHRAAKPGAAMYVLVLTTDALPADSPFPVPNLFSQEELRDILAKYWRIEEIRPAFVHVKLPPIPDLPGPSFSVDDKGRAKLPASLVSLRR